MNVLYNISMKTTPRLCSNCGSTKYYCKGFCKSCYTKQLVISGWSKKYSCCVGCGTTEKFHVAKGLCYVCYHNRTNGNLCACGCGLTTSTKRKFRKGHWARTEGSHDIFKADMNGSNNPQWGKFGKDHPAFGHKTSDETRELRRKTRLEYMSNHNSNPTSIEVILSSLLDELGISHYPQYILHNKFTVDEYLPESNSIIEAYGGYWHGDSRRFPKLSKLQMSAVKRDSSRISYLTTCGHSILILWEEELKNSQDWCKSEILSFLRKDKSFPFVQDSI